MSENELYKDAFVDLMRYVREIAESEQTDLDSPYSRGRASGIHSVLLAIDTILVTFEIDRATVGLDGLSAESWYEKEK